MRLGTRWTLLLALVSGSACATGDIEEVAQTTCESDDDCPGEEICNAFTGGCQDPASNAANAANATNSTNATNAANSVNNANSANSLNSVNPWDMGGGDDDAGESDMASPVVCNPPCASSEVCDETGMCVEACMPACQSPAICTENGCEIPDCQAAGDPCDTGRPDQGAFVCLDDDGAGKCFDKCADSFEASTCGPGEYCIDVGDTTPVNVCVSSECTDHADCTDGSCVRFDNDYGICFPAGTIAEGEACSVANNQCESGTYCRRVTAGSDAGVCSNFCDFWAATSDCPTGQACGVIFTSRIGLCSDKLTTTGTNGFDECAAAGSYCGDGMLCLGSTTPLCFPYCRPGTSDCDAYLSGGSACGNAVLPGEDTFGICTLACDPADIDPCGTGSVCVDNGYGEFICRLTCDPATVAQDCCGGDTSCNFTCNSDNLCE